MHDEGMVEKFQSAYKANHSTETALLRVYNDMLISIDQCGGATLILLDFPSAFDTIDHVLLFNPIRSGLFQTVTTISKTIVSIFTISYM